MRIIKKGATSQSLYFVLKDIDGNPLSLVYDSASLIASYTLNGAAAVAITLATLASASSSWSSGGFKQVDSTKHPGLHRLDVPNAALTGADSVIITIAGYANMEPVNEEIQLTGIDIQDAVKGGMSAIAQRVIKNTAFSAFPFLMIDSADHLSGKTGLTIVATRSIDGGAFASCTNSATEVASGMYKINLSAADVNGDSIVLKFSATGADTRVLVLLTQNG